jgi:hypothetical protein
MMNNEKTGSRKQGMIEGPELPLLGPLDRKRFVPSLLAASCLLAVLAACGEGHAASAVDSARADSIARVRQDSINRAQPGYVIDSILPMDEQLRRFRAGLKETPRTLSGAAETRDRLMRRFVRALEAADTAGLARLALTRAEFAYLVFPESPLSAPPYSQAPDLAWMQHTFSTAAGLERLLNRLGGKPLGFRSLSCSETPVVEGSNRIWKDCTVRFAPPGDSAQTLQLFASIIEREGRYKILSYSNAF